MGRFPARQRLRGWTGRVRRHPCHASSLSTQLQASSTCAVACVWLAALAPADRLCLVLGSLPLPIAPDLTHVLRRVIKQGRELHVWGGGAGEQGSDAQQRALCLDRPNRRARCAQLSGPRRAGAPAAGDRARPASTGRGDLGSRSRMLASSADFSLSGRAAARAITVKAQARFHPRQCTERKEGRPWAPQSWRGRKAPGGASASG